MLELINTLNQKFKNSTPQEILKFFIDSKNYKLGLSSSFGAEDQVLTHMLLQLDNNPYIFTLDTGRLPYETYDVMDTTNLKYNIKIDVFFPNYEHLEELYKTQGINGFYESIENRKRCCNVRKLEALKRALEDLDIWITGLRASQNVTRNDMKIFEYDTTHDVIKLSPLIHWNEEDVWEYIKKYNIPYNKLHDKGYPSIGCAPCTRAVKENEDIRSGRWWWENPEHKECGLHKIN